ncbi:hypothetical protein H6F67_00250 [Microcoleus sp. FACHB-1515]|uniref:hypothetical protein n=1 Tax=Cyanophyceae TaxID=3028117 RepID=UPI001689EF96|nr:hypothetical protein [Microcoleus sp. FACHB-1515]MBD2088306.1 hypothetical protein [Microcoleus sp. FACHB-1515]
MAPKRKPLSDDVIQDDFDPQAVEQLRQSLNIPTVSPQAIEPPMVEPPKVETKRLNVDIPLDLHRWLKSHSGQEGRSITEIVTELLDELRSSNTQMK